MRLRRRSLRRRSLERLAVLSAFALAATPGRALDPSKAIPQNSIQSILQTRDGYIWLGTERGLVRFDGVHFAVFDKGNTPGLKNSNAQALYEDRAGNFWIGTWGGLHLWRDGRLTSFTTREGLSNNRVLAICEARDGSIWIGTGGGGLNRIQNGRVTAVSTTKDGLSNDRIWSVVEDREGSLWI